MSAIRHADEDWDAVQEEVRQGLKDSEPTGWFTTPNYHVWLDMFDEVVEVQEGYESFRQIREDKLAESLTWNAIPRSSRENRVENLLGVTESIEGSIDEVLRYLKNIVVRGYRAVERYVGSNSSGQWSLNKHDNTKSQHPENRREWCKVRIEYIQYVMTESWSKYLKEDFVNPYLDGEKVNIEKMMGWMRKYEVYLENFLRWMYGLYRDLLENLDSGLSGVQAEVRDTLMTFRYNGDRPDWSDVKRLAEKLMDEPDVDEFIDVLRDVHDYGGAGRDYLGLRVWVENEEDIERWERGFDDDYDRKQHLDPDRPEPELRVELLKADEWGRRDELVDDWEPIREWCEEVQLEAPSEPEDEEPESEPAPQPTTNADVVIESLERAGVFESITGPADDFKETYRAVFEGKSTPEQVAKVLNCPPGVAEKYLGKLVDENLVDRVASLDGGPDEYAT